MSKSALVTEVYDRDDKSIEIKRTEKGYHTAFINGEEQRGLKKITITFEGIALEREYVDFEGRPLTKEDFKKGV